MSTDESRRQSCCEGKERFASARLAQRVATKIGAHGKTRRRRSAYLCSFCGYWHVGTSKGSGRRRR